MYRKWKSVCALGMAALMVCLIPMGTMMAAEDNPEDVQETGADSVSDNDAVYDDEAGLEDSESADDEVNADGNEGIEVMSETEDAEGDAEVQASMAAPVIVIEWNGQNVTCSLGGKVDYKYVNNHDQAFACSASQDGQAVSVSYCLEMVSDTTAEAKEIGKMSSLSWESENPERIPLSRDRSYVLYVKAEGEDGQITYARSGGIVVDTTAPAITELVEGKTYPEGTKFQVSDDNLESVKVNEVIVTPEPGGYYRVTANGTSSSCVIKVKDKAGNERAYSINVSGKELEEGSVISENGIYSLKAGVPYKLAAGKWQVSGDRAVYQGGSTFYVRADGDYRFTSR